MVCTKCGAPMDGGDKCPQCGALAPGKKFCQYCAEVIDEQCVICPKCGRQVSQVKAEQPNIVINNSNQSQNMNTNYNMNVNRFAGYGRPKNKWVSFFLCLFLGFLGAHKFYEGKSGMGILYIFTFGLFGIGWVIDIIALLLKPNPYFV